MRNYVFASRRYRAQDERPDSPMPENRHSQLEAFHAVLEAFLERYRKKPRDSLQSSFDESRMKSECAFHMWKIGITGGLTKLLTCPRTTQEEQTEILTLLDRLRHNVGVWTRQQTRRPPQDVHHRIRTHRSRDATLTRRHTSRSRPPRPRAAHGAPKGCTKMMQQEEKDEWDDAKLASWEDGVRATMRAWIERYFAPGDGVEFLWRARYKPDLLSQFVAHEPWIAGVDRLTLRPLLIDATEACGYTCLLADKSSRKARVVFPDGKEHRVTGVVTGIKRKK